jgi:PleD family two-component response regulator
MRARGERCDDFLADAIQQASWLKSMSLIAPSGRIREQQLRESNRQLRQLAYADALSGLANRRAFNGQFATDWRSAAEFASAITVLIIDVDHFKLFNDHYGHVAGDRCLKKISEVLVAGTRTRADGEPLAMPPSFRPAVARACDFTARYGGEEFAVLLQRADLDTARRVAERLRRAVENLNIAHEGSPLGCVTISVGAASTVPAEGDSALELVEMRIRPFMRPSAAAAMW